MRYFPKDFDDFFEKVAISRFCKELYSTANLSGSPDPPLLAPSMRPSIGIFHFEGFVKKTPFVQTRKEPYNTANLKASLDLPFGPAHASWYMSLLV